MSRVGRNRKDPNDLVERIVRLEERIRALETARRASSTSVEQGGLLFIRDGRFFLTEATNIVDKGTKGRILMSFTSADDDNGYRLAVERQDGFTGWASDVAFAVKTVDGGNTGEPITSTVELFDKQGGQFVSDTIGRAPGMGDPKLAYPWHDTSMVKSSTSSSFATVGSIMWYPYHPHVRIQLLLQNDVGSTSEIRITNGAGDPIYEETYAGGTNAYTPVTLNRTIFEPEPTHVNGNGQFITVQFRRASGAGTVRAMITDVVGLDLSMF